MRRIGLVAMAGLAIALGGCDTFRGLFGGGERQVADDLPPAAQCGAEADRAALETRIYQTDLMVSALSCGEKDRYNSFVQRFRGELVANGQNLQALFKRTYEDRAKKELNKYVTQVANDSSKRSIANINTFCAATSEQFSTVLVAEPTDLRTFVVNYPEVRRQGPTICAQIAESPG